jgi:rod shape-determining protein MreD
MRFVPWFILAYLVLGLQSGLAPYIQIDNAPPNLVLPAVIFIALYAPRDAALLGTYVMGLMQDTISGVPLGTNALVYAAVTFGVRVTQPTIDREHWLTHVILALVGGVLQAAILTMVGMRRHELYPWSMLIISTLYTAAVAPFILKPLHKIKRVFGFQPERKLPGRA